MKEKFSEEQNKKKYTRGGIDLMERWKRRNSKMLISYCMQNIQKLVVRYVSDADKANNPADLEKAISYLDRYSEVGDIDIVVKLRELIAEKDIQVNLIETICEMVLDSVYAK